MPYIRPTRDALIQTASDELATRLGLDALLPRSILDVHAKVSAGQAHLIHGHLAWVARQIIASTADGPELAERASLYGVFRKAAAKATGTTRFGGIESSVIPAGTVIRRVDGTNYTTDAAGTITTGVADVAVTASIGGLSSNAAAATDLSLVSPIVGVDTISVVLSPGLSGGDDAEDDADLLARLLQEIRNTPQGGAKPDYVTWALLAATFVTRAFTIPLHFGEGTVGLTFLEDDSVPIIPSAGDVQTVQEFVDVLRPVTAILTVFAPAEKKIDPTIVLTPDTTDVRLAVSANLVDMLLATAAPGKTITISKIREAISTAAGEDEHALTLPVADVTALAGEIVTLGTITWA